MVTQNSADFGTGTSGQVLTSNGAGVAPTFQAAAGGITPYFAARLTTLQSNKTGSGEAYTIIFDTADSNVGAAYNTSTGVFTVPSDGVYSFTAQVTAQGFTTHTLLAFTIVKSGAGEGLFFLSPLSLAASAQIQLTSNLIMKCTASEVVTVTYTVDGGAGGTVIDFYGANDGTYYTSFSGFKIGS